MSLFTGLSGVQAAQTDIDTIGNNIANVNTTGFKASVAGFADLYGSAVQSTPGQGVFTASLAQSFTEGTITQTGQPLDVAINGPGYVAVRQQNGQLAYTRQLSLHIQPDGQLVTRDGLSVAPPVRVPTNALSVSIAQDGRVSARTGPSTVAALGKLTVVSFAAPENLREQSGLYIETLGSGRPQTGATGPSGSGAGAIGVMAGYQLRSTVDLATEMSNMIEAQRMYEANSKALQTLDALVNTTVTLGAH